jgi:hydroxymethylpyrimidine kinase/phosphomethylpyrimidine kinase/thiamine-phosphate diphosphorylase
MRVPEVPPRKFALTIAGSDSSGGAGIQADLRAFNALDIVCASVVTAVTAQGPTGVSSVQLVDPELVRNQIDEAFEMYDFDAVKVGMLGGKDQVVAVAECLRKRKLKNVILDPVLVSTSGTNLLDELGVSNLLDRLLPIVDVATPNRFELGALTGMPVSTDEQCIAAAKSLIGITKLAVVVTGGDTKPRSRDLIIESGIDELSVERPHVETEHTHGTGCAFSSLVAGFMAYGQPLSRAVLFAKSLIYGALQYPIIPKAGKGFPDIHRVNTVMTDTAHFSHVNNEIRGIYALTDDSLYPGRSHADMVEAAMLGGAKVIQVRNKNLSTPELLKLCKEIRDLTIGRAALIVNDRVDVALACNADGVHLGPDDMPPREARNILGRSKIIGASVGTVEEARVVIQDVSYLAVGAVFGSSTKADAGSAIGVKRIEEIKAKYPSVPLVAIGGINLSNIASVAAAGADAAAVVSAIVCAPDPKQATRELLAEFERGRAMRAAIQ